MCIYPCQDEILAAPPAAEQLGDVVREEFVGGAPTWFESDAVHTVRLEPARYRFIFDDDQSPADSIEEAVPTFELLRITD